MCNDFVAKIFFNNLAGPRDGTASPACETPSPGRVSFAPSDASPRVHRFFATVLHRHHALPRGGGFRARGAAHLRETLLRVPWAGQAEEQLPARYKVRGLSRRRRTRAEYRTREERG